MYFIYQRIFKEGYGNHKYLRFPYLQYNNFNILRTGISFNKVDLVCLDRVISNLLYTIQVLLPNQTQFICMVYS